MNTKKRPIQYFGAAYLEQCKTLSPLQIIEFLEDFRLVAASQQNTEKKK